MISRSCRPQALAVAVLMAALAPDLAGSAEGTPKKLGGAEIRARIGGNDLTDGIHWRRHFQRSGVLVSFDLGKENRGRWTVQGDRLCFAVEKSEPLECYEVLAVSAHEIRLHDKDTGYDLGATIERHGKGRQ